MAAMCMTTCYKTTTSNGAVHRRPRSLGELHAPGPGHPNLGGQLRDAAVHSLRTRPSRCQGPCGV
eukprot:7146232-Pyramimonas_sp.AAC.1